MSASFLAVYSQGHAYLQMRVSATDPVNIGFCKSANVFCLSATNIAENPHFSTHRLEISSYLPRIIDRSMRSHNAVAENVQRSLRKNRKETPIGSNIQAILPYIPQKTWILSQGNANILHSAESILFRSVAFADPNRLHHSRNMRKIRKRLAIRRAKLAPHRGFRCVCAARPYRSRYT